MRVALAGLFGRKLRTALTAIAIVLGVAMVTGHVHPHRLDQGRVRRDLHRDLPAAPTRRSPASPRSTSRTSRARPRRRSTSRCSGRCATCPTSPTPSAASAAIANLVGTNGKVIAFGGAPHLGFSVDPDAAAVQHAHARRRRLAGRERGRRRQGDGGQEGPRGRPDDRRRGERPGAADEDLRARQVRRRVEPRRRHARRLRPADGAGALRQASGKLDQIRAKAKAGRHARAAHGRDPEDPAAGHAGADRRGAGDRGRLGHDELHRLPAELPARVRRHRALRRRVRDRELALDHDRPAHARVRDAAHARRLAAPGARPRS